MTDPSSNDDSSTAPDSKNVSSILDDFVDSPEPDEETDPHSEYTPDQNPDSPPDSEVDSPSDSASDSAPEPAPPTADSDTLSEHTHTDQQEGDTESSLLTDEEMKSISEAAAAAAEQSPAQSEDPTGGTPPEQADSDDRRGESGAATGTGSAIRQEATELLARVIKTGGRFVAVAMATTLSVGKRWVEGGSDPDSGLAGMFYPEDKLSESESVTWADTPSRWHAVGPWSLASFWFASAIILATTVQSGLFSTWLGSRLPGTTTVTPPQWWPSLVAGFVILGFLTVVGESLRRASTWYVVTGERIIHRRGIISSRIPVIRHNNVTSAEEQNPFPLNLVNVGHIDVYTASVDGLELRINVIKQPKGRENQLNAHRDDSTEHQQENDPADQSSDTAADSDEYQGAF